MQIRKMNEGDAQAVLAMMKVFYASPAVLHKCSDDILKQDIADCIGSCPYVEGYVFAEDTEILGYAMTANNYSTEFGGLCIWIEDLYLRPEYRGRGIGSAFFKYLETNNRGKAVRYRLEVEEENRAAIGVYKTAGYEVSPYIVMEKNPGKK